MISIHLYHGKLKKKKKKEGKTKNKFKTWCLFFNLIKKVEIFT